MENDNFNADIGQFFDFGEAALPEFNDLSVEPRIADSTVHSCPSHPNSQECLCHGFMNDFDFNLGLDDAMTGINPTNITGDEFNNDFSNWIPRYKKPDVACLYCQSKGLDCFFTYEEQTSCSACSTLFRPCSFQKPESWLNKPKDAMDTLHPVSEDVAFPFGGLTGIAQLKSYHGEGERGRSSGTRFSRPTIKILRDWLDEHADHPYPTEAEKEELKARTGLKTGQISNWLANARRRGKVRPKRAISPSIRPNTQPMDIPKGKTWETMTPFDRWKYSPPENEPAPLSAIAHAVNQFPSPPEAISVPTSHSGQQNDSRSASSECFSSALQAPSTASFETGKSALSSGQLSSGSFGSAWSYSTRNSFNSHNSLGSGGVKKDRRRRRRPAPKALQKPSKDTGPRLFKCTFCTDTFKTKYDWSRHEKSLHISLEKWICSPLGEVITCSASGQKKCVFCDEIEPTKEHLDFHNHSACEEKGMQARTFYRKDHLRQHLRLMHGVSKMTPAMENWKSEPEFINSRCGFCSATFTRWQDRIDHLAKEFRNGATMANWKGCRGLDHHVAAQVTLSMPPYLISNEAKSPWPFSASNRANVEQQAKFHNFQDLEAILTTPIMPETNGSSSGQYSSSNTGPQPSPNAGGFCAQLTTGLNDNPNQNRATCWEILTLRLGKFAKQQVALGITLTDEMLQREAREILYQGDDPWNQTAADNPEWLTLFKKAHGLQDVSSDFDRRDALEDMGVLGGLSWHPEYDIANMGPAAC